MSSFISLDLNHKSAGVEDESEALRRILPVLRRQPGYPTKVLALFEDEIVVSSCWLRRSLAGCVANIALKHTRASQASLLRGDPEEPLDELRLTYRVSSV